MAIFAPLPKIGNEIQKFVNKNVHLYAYSGYIFFPLYTAAAQKLSGSTSRLN